MGKPFDDLTGRVFGRLTVLNLAGRSKSGLIQYACMCSCPRHPIILVTGKDLRSGNTKSCGCYHRDMASLANMEDLTGKTFGRLTVICRVPNSPPTTGNPCGRVQYKCQCSCPNRTVVIVSAYCLTSGRTKSCGCFNRERSSQANTKWHTPEEQKLSDTLAEMKQRCCNPRNDNYSDYGGRGIHICEEWLNNNRSFIDWSLSHGYKLNSKLSINRVDNDGPYAPWNCEWTNRSTQMNNTRANHKFEINGVIHTVKEWSDISGIDYYHLRYLSNADPQRFLDEVTDSKGFIESIET